VQEIDLFLPDDTPHGEVLEQGKYRVQQHGVFGEVDPDDMKTVYRLLFRGEKRISKRNYRDVVPKTPERSGKFVDVCRNPPDVREEIHREYADPEPHSLP